MFEVESFTFDQACNLTEEVLECLLYLIDRNFIEFLD